MDSKRLSANEIKRVRESLGMTQEEFATFLRLGGKSQSMVSSWETGRAGISRESAENIRSRAAERGVDVTVPALMGLTDTSGYVAGLTSAALRLKSVLREIETDIEDAERDPSQQPQTDEMTTGLRLMDATLEEESKPPRKSASGNSGQGQRKRRPGPRR